jgi:hypothetical protein
MCSRPTCGRGTSGPHSDPAKSVITGKAAHICAAQSRGPRYDQNQTSAERKGVENAIWLCSDCATLVDRDPTRFAAELLRDWKRQHEERVRGGDLVPPLPEISWETSGGLSLPVDRPAVLTGEHMRLVRGHTLTITNRGATVLLDLHIEAQLPEPALIAPGPSSTTPAGVSVVCSPAPLGFQAAVSGSGSVRWAGTDARGVWTIHVDRLIPNRLISIKWLTRPHRHPHTRRRMPTNAALD